MNKFVILVVLLLLLASCSKIDFDFTISEDQEIGILDLEQVDIKVGKEKFKADKGVILVPENRDIQGSPLISLPVIRIHGLNESLSEPIFYLGGGPGSSNMKFRRFKGLINNHDIVLVGYRGADGSNILNSKKISKAAKGLGNDLFSKQSIENYALAVEETVKDFDDAGIQIEGYTIPAVVKDIEQVRLVLSYEKINLLSQSYGTRVAQIYAYMFPEIINRSAMISVNPPGHFVWEPDMIDSQIRHYSNLWTADSACVNRSANLEETMKNVLNKLPDNWMFFNIDPGKVKFITFMLLYHRSSSAMVFDTYIRAENGDASGMALMCILYDLMIPRMIIWGDTFSKSASDYNNGRDYYNDMDPDGSILGSPGSMLFAGIAERNSWPYSGIPGQYLVPDTSYVNTLMLSGNIDFSTPAEFTTDELLPYLPNGTQLILSEFGHTDDIWNLQPESTIALLTNYFDNGIINESIFSYEPMNFETGLSYGAYLKIGLAVLSLLIILIIFGLIKLIRKIIG